MTTTMTTILESRRAAQDSNIMMKVAFEKRNESANMRRQEQLKSEGSDKIQCSCARPFVRPHSTAGRRRRRVSRGNRWESKEEAAAVAVEVVATCYMIINKMFSLHKEERTLMRSKPKKQKQNNKKKKHKMRKID